MGRYSWEKEQFCMYYRHILPTLKITRKLNGYKNCCKQLRTVNSKIGMEWDNHDNWRQQHWLTCINRIPKRYIEVFEAYDLNNHITKATRIGKRLIDCIISNIPANRILHSDVLPCPTISDHGAPYIIANVPVNSKQDPTTFKELEKHWTRKIRSWI